MERSDSDVVSSISSLFPEMPFTMDDIRRPDSGKILNLYMNFVNLVLNEEIKFVETLKPGDCLDDHTLNAVAIYKGIKYIFRQSEFNPPVYPGDVLLPNAESVRRLLSAFINICAFQEMVEEQMQACRLELLEKKQQTDRLEQRLLEKQKQIYEAAVCAQTQKTEEERIETETAKLSEQLMNMELKHSDLSSQLHKAENESAVTREELDKLTCVLSRHEAEVQQLRGKIVEDPERMKTESSRVKETEEEIVANIEASNQRVRELESLLAAVKQKSQQAEERIRCIQALENVDSLMKNRNEEVSALLKTMKDCDLAVSNIEAELKRENQTLGSLSATKQEQQAALDSLKEAHGLTVHQLKEKQQEMEERLHASHTAIKNGAAEILEVENHIDILKKEAEETQNRLQQQIEQCYKEGKETSEQDKTWLKDLQNHLVTKVSRDK